MIEDQMNARIQCAIAGEQNRQSYRYSSRANYEAKKVRNERLECGETCKFFDGRQSCKFLDSCR